MPNFYLRTAVGSLALSVGLGAAALGQQRPGATPYFRDEATASRSALTAALRHSRPLTLDVSGLRAALATAPPEAQPGAAPLTLALPLPDGRTGRFAVVATDLMAPALAAQFPQIKTYRGVGLDDPTATVRLDLTPQGFHAQILSPTTGTIYLDPAARGDQQHVVSFFRRDMNRAAAGATPVCQFQPTAAEVTALQQRLAAAGTGQRTLISTGPTLRTYRLAVAATGEYTAFQGGTVALGQAAIVTSINRITGVYEKELAVRLQLIGQNSSLVYTNSATDPYSNGNPTLLLTQNQNNLDAIIGSGGYDIGHVFSTGGGGLAALGVVCLAGNKARGETGVDSPVGDAFDIDYVAHELGNQFGGNHTFNSPLGGCASNGNAATAYEPGSGTTIMAYAGICDADNVQSHSDAYFHSASFQELAAFVASTACGASTATGNTAPTVTVPATRTLPIGTPFRLTATATDAEGDALTYNWEQMNTGPFASLTTPQAANSNVPLFRSFTASSSPTRYFPRLASILSNTSTEDERLPTVTRTLTFRCTARDQHNGAAGVVGGVNYSANLTLPVTSAAGPFLVTAPNTALTWTGSSTQTVTWNVAGTTANGVNCATVNILLSTDGGQTYPTTLASGVANDGTQTITVPNTATTTARIMVAAADNYFFDISNANFTIQAATDQPLVTTPADGALTSDNTPAYAGTAPANATVTVYVDGGSIGTTTTNVAGNWTLTPVTPLTDGPHQVYATAQSSGLGVSANSSTHNFTVDATAPTVTLTSTSGPDGGTATTSPMVFTATFSEAVTGFTTSGITVSNGTITSGPSAGSGNSYLIQVTPATAGTVTTVRVVAGAAQDAAGNGNQASGPYSLTYSPASAAWTGTTSIDWFTAGNWSTNQVPTATTNVTILATNGSTVLRQPVIGPNAAQAAVRNLTINNGAALSIGANTLEVNGNITNNGTFLPTAGTVVLGNTTPGSILGSGTIRFWNLTVGPANAQLSTSAGAAVRRQLTLNGNFATNGNPFTLTSTASGTAMVVNNGSSVVQGPATVQRYIDPGLNPNLGYRHVSAPVSAATVGSLTTGSFTPVVNAAYNSSPTPNLTTPFPTVYGYDQARLATTSNNLGTFDKGWYSPATLGDPLAVGQGYTALLPADQTWSFTGALNTGTVALNLARNSGATAAAAGLHLLGNPYPSPLDWRLVTPADRPNVDGAIYVYASNNPANPYAGAYGFYNNGFGTVSPVLPLGQGFFVRVTPGQTAGSVTLRNSQRPTSYADATYQRPTTDTRPQVQLALQPAGSAVSDRAFVYFEPGATDAFDPQYDAEKLPNPSGLNLSTSLSATQRLSIDGRAPLGSAQVVVPLAVGVPTTGSYTLAAAELLNLTGTPTYLRDLQTGAVVDLAQQPSYPFTVSNASALLTGRFELVFSPQRPLATAPAALVQQIGLYPNPAAAKAFVELPASLGRQAVPATLVDAVGREVRTLTLPAQGAAAHTLDLRGLPVGVYLLRLNTSAGSIVKKLTVE